MNRFFMVILRMCFNKIILFVVEFVHEEMEF